MWSFLNWTSRFSKCCCFSSNHWHKHRHTQPLKQSSFIQCSHLIFIPYCYLSYFISLFLSLSPLPPFPILCSSSCFFPSLFNFPALLYIHSFLPPAPPHFQISFEFPYFIFPNLLSFCPSCPSLSYWLTTICLYFLLSPSSIFSLFISTHTLYFKMHFTSHFSLPYFLVSIPSSLLLISPFLIFFHSSFSVVPLHTLY